LVPARPGWRRISRAEDREAKALEAKEDWAAAIASGRSLATPPEKARRAFQIRLAQARVRIPMGGLPEAMKTESLLDEAKQPTRRRAAKRDRGSLANSQY